jgi:hypothetical protein
VDRAKGSGQVTTRETHQVCRRGSTASMTKEKFGGAVLLGVCKGFALANAPSQLLRNPNCAEV